MKAIKHTLCKLAMLFCVLFGLMSVSVSAATTYFTSSDGMYTFYVSSDNKATITKYHGGSTTLTFPSTVKSGKKTYNVIRIGDGKERVINKTALKDVKNIVTSSGIQYVNTKAFEGCTGLKSFKASDSLTSVGNSAFSGCKSLTSVTLGKNVTTINASAFKKCTKLASIVLGDKVKEIGESAFSGCSALTKVTSATPSYSSNYLGLSNFDNYLPRSLTSLGKSAFYNTKLTGSLFVPANLETVSSQAFYGCTKLTAVYVTNGVKKLEEKCFANCTGLKKIFVSSGVTSITDSNSEDASFANSIINEQTKVVLFEDSVMDEYLTSAAFPAKVISYITTKNPIAAGSMAITATAPADYKLSVAGNVVTMWAGTPVTLDLAYSSTNASLETSDSVTWKVYNPDLKITASHLNHAKVTSAVAGGYYLKAIANEDADAEINFIVKAAPKKLTVVEKGKTAAASSHTIDVTSGTKTLNLSYAPSPVNNAPVYFTSSDTSIAKVDRETGVVTVYKKEGTATITAKTYNDISATYKITTTIKRAPYTEWKQTDIKIPYGKLYTFTKSVSGMKVVSSNPSVVSVNSKGQILGKTAGSAVVSIYNDSKIAKCTVTVIPKNQKISSASVSGKQVTLKWEKQAGVSGYEVYYSTSKNSGYKKIQSERKQSQNTYKFTTLKANKTYYFKVRSFYKSGSSIVYGNFSAVKKVKTKAAN